MTAQTYKKENYNCRSKGRKSTFTDLVDKKKILSTHLVDEDDDVCIELVALMLLMTALTEASCVHLEAASAVL